MGGTAVCGRKGRQRCRLLSEELRVTSARDGSRLAHFKVPPTSWELLGPHRDCTCVPSTAGAVPSVEAVLSPPEDLRVWLETPG